MPGETKSNLTRSDLPEGTVTFLFTDIEGSTELLNTLGDAYVALLSDQREVLRNFFIKWNGQEIDTQGDAFFYSFPRATEAVSAAVEAQRAISTRTWTGDVEVRVRMGLHTGEPSTWEEGYVGMDVHRAARIAHVGHGGQVLLSDTTASLIRNDQMEGVGLLELGKYRLKGLRRPKRIYQLEIDGLPSEFPPLISPDAGLPPHNLPLQPTPFVGRGPELEALNEMIAEPDVRLISIVAAGGMGKTRIALASSEHQLSITERTNGILEARFPQGVYFVPLAPLDSPRSIVPTIAEALNFQIESGKGKEIGAGGETRSPKQQLLDYVRSKRLLLIMDNFEHLLEGAGLLNEILDSAPEVKILVTSRERLHLKGEHLFPLLGMKFPDLVKIKTSTGVDHQAYSALALFLQSAQRIQPDFTITDEDIEDVTSICRLVGGMPLGIELSASWVNMLTVNEIAKEIQRSLDFLGTRLRDIDVRHRSMRAVFDSTWERMSNSERDLFIRLTVFHGGFTRDAAQEVAGASLNLLGDLSNRSLLQFDRVRGTYEMHELLHQFGAERLAQDSQKEKTIRHKHSTYYCHLLSQLETALKGSQHEEAMAEVEADFENITAAWKWAVEQGQIELITTVLEAMDFYYEYRGRWEECEIVFRDAVDRIPSSQSVDTLRLRVRLNSLVAGNIPAKRMDQRKELIETNRELLKVPALAQEDTRFEEASLLTLVGRNQKDGKEERRHYQSAYDLFESLNDRWQMARLLGFLGDVGQSIGDFKWAIDQTKKSLTIFKELDFKREIARRLDRLSAIMVVNMELEKAESYLLESLEISEQLGDRRTLGWTLGFLGFLKIHQGLFKDAGRIFNESIDINEDLGQTFSVIYANIELANIKNHLGKYREALTIANKAQKDAEQENFGIWIASSLVIQGDALLGEGDYQKGGELLQESIEMLHAGGSLGYVSSVLPTLGICMHGLGDYGAMRDVMQEALQINARVGSTRAYTHIFPALALLELVDGEVERAIEFYAYAASYRYVADSQWFYDVVGRHIELAAESLPAEFVVAAQERGRKLDPGEVAKELLIELESSDESVNNG
jgi:predicted ATPase/class 3 adenylate cyclase/tetratricopeptide (TPR) repeat protein